MILHIFYLSVVATVQIGFGTAEGGRKYRSLGRVDYNENSFRCPTEGFHADARDCRIFYRCVDWTSNDYFRDYTEPQFTAFRFECGEGTVFDPDFSICNHPGKTKRAECGNRQLAGNNNIGYPTLEESHKPPTYPSQNQQSSYPTQGGFPNESENQILPNNEEKNSREPLDMSDNCQSSGFYPVKGNCQKFIRCVNNGNGGYTKYEFNCGPGTVWDPVNTVCNYPSQVPGCEELVESEKLGQVGYPGQDGGRPGQGGMAGQGGYPGQDGGRPGQGGMAGQGGYPGPDGGRPGQGGMAGQGGYPGPDGGRPGQGGMAGQGGYPGQNGGRPGQGGYPGQDGGRPGQGGYPGQDGGRPGQGGYPGQDGGRPGQGGMAGQGGYPGQNGGRPGQGGYPGQDGGRPGQGGYPGQDGGRPGQGGMAGQGGYPGQNGGRPGQGGYPGQDGGRPGQGGMAGQGGYPGQDGGRPGQGGYPGQNGGRPGQGGYPGQDGGRPGQGGMAGQGGYPGQNGGRPGQGGYPGQDGGRPGQGGMPGQGGYPGQDKIPDEGISEKPEGNTQGGIFSGTCNSPGFYGVPGNCKKFIRCVENENGSFNKYEFECGAGTVWDIQLNTCNHAYMVKGCENTNQMPTVGEVSGTSKPEENGYPGPGETPVEGGYPGLGGTPGEGGYPEKRPDSSNNFESKNHSSGNPSECQNDGFYPVKNNCQTFFRCVNNGKDGYLRYDFQCGEGTVWDQENQVCNYPWAVARKDINCDMSSTSQTQTTSSSSSSSSTFSQSTSYYNSSASSQNQFSTSSTAVQTGTSQTQSQTGVASSSHTQNQGSQTTSNQTSNQGWNQFSSTRPTEQGSTKPMGSQPKPTTENPELQTSSPVEDLSKPPPGSSPCDKNKMPSQIKCEKAGFYPDPIDCSKFYRCVDWGDNKFSVYYFECGKGTIWDPALETCNYEKSVYPLRDCSTAGTESSQKPSSESSTLSPATGESNNAFTTEKPASSTPISMTTTKQPTTMKPSTIITIPNNSTSTRLPTSESQTTTTMPISQTPSTSATEMTTSSYQTDIITNASVEATESTTSMPSSTDSTESSTKTDEFSEMTTESKTTSPTEEYTDSSTASQMETTVPSSNSEPTEPIESTTSQMTTTGASSEKDPNCPQLNDDQSAFVCPTGFRRHPKDCNLFYQCTTSKDTGDINIMILSCKNDTIYDERKIQCLPPEETDSCQNQGQRRRVYRRAENEFLSVVYVSPFKSLCPKEGSFPYEGDCTRFYKCKKNKRGKIQGYLYQCPENYSFYDVTGRCEKSSNLPKCMRSIPEVTQKSLKWMKSKVPVEYFSSAFN